MHGLSAKVSRYLSPTVKIPSHAQDQEHQHGTCAAELPGICNVNLVSDTMDDGIPPSAWSRGVSEPEKPTPGASARAEVPRACGGIRSDFRAERAKGTGYSIEDGAHRVANQASQSVAQYLSPFSHNGWPLSARMHLRTAPSWDSKKKCKVGVLYCQLYVVSLGTICAVSSFTELHMQ